MWREKKKIEMTDSIEHIHQSQIRIQIGRQSGVTFLLKSLPDTFEFGRPGDAAVFISTV